MKLTRPFTAVLAVLAMSATAAPVMAQNRVLSMMIQDIRNRGVSDADMRRTVAFYDWADQELLPGIIESRGAFSSRANPPVTVIAARLFNESRIAICFRAMGRLISGPLVGSRGNGRLGQNVLLEAGRNDTILVHSLPSYVGSTGPGTMVTAYYMWLPAPAGTAQRCASSAPPDLERWAAQTPPDRNTAFTRYTPELERRLLAAASALPIPAMLRAPSTARLK